jgi:hypothetical protein
MAAVLLLYQFRYERGLLLSVLQVSPLAFH